MTNSAEPKNFLPLDVQAPDDRPSSRHLLIFVDVPDPAPQEGDEDQHDQQQQECLGRRLAYRRIAFWLFGN